MQKELNPELFGGPVNSKKVVETPPQFDPGPWEQKLGDLRLLSTQYAQQLQTLASQMMEFQKSAQLKFDRLSQALHRLEQSHQITTVEAAGKISHLNQRLGERKTLDLKMQELVDRHNSVLRGFEVRITHLQKLLSEKDAQVMSALSSLNEARMEISRLKRL